MIRTLIVMIVAGLITSCFPSFIKSLHPLPLHEGTDTTGPLKVTAAASVVYYPQGDDKDHPDTHYRIGVGAFDGFVATEGNAITDADIQNIKSVTVFDKTSKQVVPSDTKYSCGYNADKTNAAYSGFDCLLKTTSVGSDKKIYFAFGMKDNTQWTSEDLDLSKFSYSSDFGDELASIGESTPLYVCPDGKHTYYSSDCDCPPDAPCACPTGSTFDATQKKCITAAKKAICAVGDQTCLNKVPADPSQNQLCGSGNYILLGGKCGTTCGKNQVGRAGKCQCLDNYIPDTSDATNCMIKPAFSAAMPQSPSSGGGSCSLIR